MTEIKIKLKESLDEAGYSVYHIYPYHSISDVLRHLAEEVNNDWDHLIQLCKLLKKDNLK